MSVSARTASPRFVAFPASLVLALLLAVVTAPAAAAQCGSGTLTYTFTNACAFPVWVGQHSTAPVAPEGGSWEIAPPCTQGSDCPSGTCTAGQCTCSAQAACPGGATCSGGVCSTSITFCMPETWQSGTFWGRTGCSGSASDFSCATGQCGDPGMLQCAVTGGTPMNPVSQFEVTSIVSATGQVAANYDLSLVAGYNLPLTVQPTGGNFNGAACSVPGCTTDLNTLCPTALRDTVPTTSTPTHVPCGHKTYCPEGACVQGSCVVGCLDPCTQCQRNPSTPGLDCNTQVGSLTYTGCDGNSYDVTYLDLYCAKNTQATDGNAMASGNQGTPTCFGDVDCPAGSSCVTSGFATGFQPPAGSGVCIDPSNPDYKDAQITCGASTVGQACGGYLQDYAGSDALGYTCQPVTLSSGTTAYPCLPPLTSGMGTCTKPDTGHGGATLYSAGGGVFNQAWVDAGVQAGGGTTAYYSTFHQACPNAYAWQYDDAVGGYACTAPTGFTVTFCK